MIGKSAPTLNEFLRSETMKANKTYDPKTKKWYSTYGEHYNRTNHGAADLINGTRTKFDTNAGKYVTEKLSPTEHWLETQKFINPGSMEPALGL